VVISIYNQYGEQIRTILSAHQASGLKEIFINAEDFIPGMYFCRIKIGNNQVETDKMIIAR
jgi:hypothetical protein